MKAQHSEIQATVFTGSVENLSRLRAMAEELGGVGVHGVSLRLGRSAGDGKYDNLPSDDRERQERLDCSIKEALVQGCAMQKPGIIVQRLERNGVRSVRDILCLGRVGLSHGIAHISSAQRDKIATALQAIYPEETFFTERPTPTDIAGFCLSLDQVHGGVLPRYGQYLDERRDEIAANDAAGYCTRVPEELERYKAGMRVSDILTNNYPNPPGYNPAFTPASVFTPEVFVKCQEQARIFAAEFTLARQQLEPAILPNIG